MQEFLMGQDALVTLEREENEDMPFQTLSDKGDRREVAKKQEVQMPPPPAVAERLHIMSNGFNHHQHRLVDRTELRRQMFSTIEEGTRSYVCLLCGDIIEEKPN